ncbi:hypothetical protein F7725_026786 [Dissostichus mawsoni]|uniref:Uncharacterized protein n=1 Tax=Dissostichus mawsoni TaxID=36200 RepID=A0A7J5X858_DISMA|nr:hypothetical protein F7725_026786 [Dissostichus mawsoni]
MDITSYLVLHTSYYTASQMKAYKSLEAFNYFVCGWVNDLGTKEALNKCRLVFARGETPEASPATTSQATSLPATAESEAAPPPPSKETVKIQLVSKLQLRIPLQNYGHHHQQLLMETKKAVTDWRKTMFFNVSSTRREKFISYIVMSTKSVAADKKKEAIQFNIRKSHYYSLQTASSGLQDPLKDKQHMNTHSLQLDCCMFDCKLFLNGEFPRLLPLAQL